MKEVAKAFGKMHALTKEEVVNSIQERVHADNYHRDRLRCFMETAKIVVVDDDREMRDTVQAILEMHGYTAVTAGNRDEGMATIRRERPELVILDVMMESWQDGFNMSREIRKDPELRDIRILMLTAIGERTGIDVKSSAGDPTWLPVDSFLEKPVEPNVLLSQIQRLLLVERQSSWTLNKS